jgi:sugar phosphate permease
MFRSCALSPQLRRAQNHRSHFSRKCYTNVKMDLVKSGVDKNILSQMDMAFMFTYAIGSFATGRLGDMFPQNVIIGYGLIGSTLCLGMIQFFEYIGIVETNYPMAFFLFVMAQFIHGLFQATGGPVNTAVMGNWWPKKGRGLVFGLWTCHQYIGDIVAALATAAIVKAGFAWQWALLLPGIANGVWGVVNLYYLPNSPAEVGIQTEEEKAAKASGGGGSSGGTISFMQAVRIPNVMGYAIAFGFFKFVNYAMFFWLPFFLALHFDPQAANVISTLYSVGMMPGGVIVGWVSDLLGGRRACVIAVFMTLLAPLLWIFAMFSDTMPPILLLVLLCIMGILVGGPNNIITSAVAADLAEDPSIGGNTRSLGTVTGIINGTGSITAAFGLMVIGPLQGLGGWTAVWYFLIACVVVGTLLMGPKIIKEITDHK